MVTVLVRFYEELNDFLPRKYRKCEYVVKSNDARSIKDLIEAEGVPHTEVDLILVNGKSVGFDYQIHENDRISVYPCIETLDITQVSRLGRSPLRHPCFIADVNLGKLCRNLRLLGLDCLYDNHSDDAQISAVSQKEKRIILTRDRGLLKRKSVTHGIFIHSQHAIEQTHEVIKRIHVENYIVPFTRCLRCNGLLMEINKLELHKRVPAEVYHSVDTFYRCSDCFHVYWKGSHCKKLMKIVKKILIKIRIEF